MAVIRLFDVALCIASLFITAFTANAHVIDAVKLLQSSSKVARTTLTIDLSNYQVPLSNGTASLPSPTSQLRAIVLGRGTQNYTCSTSTPNASPSNPVLIGARAYLFDLSPILSAISANSPYSSATTSTVETVLSMLPAYALEFTENRLRNDSGLSLAGHHIFDSTGVPCFFLRKIGLGVLKGKKMGDIVAPAFPSYASPGTEAKKVGASAGVDWLMLVNKDGGVSSSSSSSRRERRIMTEKRTTDTNANADNILQQVYRVNTAGGKAPPGGCPAGKDHVEVPYAALYWFYG